MNQTFGVELDPESAFEELTVAHLAEMVEEQLLAELVALSHGEVEALLAKDE